MSGFIDWLLEPLQHHYNQRALVAALLIGFTNGYASAFVVLRRAALKVGSLSHALLPGIAVAILITGLSDWSAFTGGLIAALIVGLGSLAVSRGSRIDQDSALAILYTAAFSGGIVILRRIGVTNELSEWLFGNIMSMSNSDLWIAFIIAAIALTTLTALQRPLVMMMFEPNVAASLGVPVRALNYVLMGLLILVLISSLQAVGCILALGLLVTPAAIMFLFTNSTSKLFWGGGIIGASLSMSAIFIGWWLDLEQGPTIVLLLGIAFAIGFLVSPRYGLFKR